MRIIQLLGLLFGFVVSTTIAQPNKSTMLGVYTFEDSTFAAFGLMDDKPFITFDDGNIRAIRPTSKPKTFEFGNTLGLFDQIEGNVKQLDKNLIELTRFGEPVKLGKKINFVLKDYTFKNGDVSLSGTLILPPGPGPFPCIIFTHGSGSERREASFGLAFFFASNGIAAFVYDKRFANDRDLHKYLDSFENYAEDAVAAATMLSTIKSVDSKKIGIYGHSQGGWVAPLAASKSKLFSFLIISGGNAVTPVQQHLYNGSCALRQAGVPERAIKEIYDFRLVKYEAGITGNHEKFDEELPIARQKPWFVRTGETLPTDKFWKVNGYYDSGPALMSLEIPVLVIAGELDRYSDTQKNMEIFQEIFNKSGNSDVTYRVFPGANHAMLETPTGKLDESEILELKRFASGYFDLLTSWVRDKIR